MECYDDKEVFHALLSKVEEWAKAKRNENDYWSSGIFR